MQPRILIVYTGGTIGMIEDPVTKALKPFDFTYLLENVPKLKMLDYKIDNIQFHPPLDSSNMNIEHWQEMVKSIADNYEDYDGFVVLHGTDTMAYTASALSFMLQNLSKPVIITGSQLPIGEVRTDGEENLITALQIAAARDDDGKPMVREVAILFENYLWRGNRSTKRSADNFNAFRSNNYPELAKIGLGIQFHPDSLLRQPAEGPLKVFSNMDPNLVVIDLYPGITESQLNYLFDSPGIKGVILRTYGKGNAPTTPWFLEAVRRTVERGVVVVNVTQCRNGGVNTKRYITGDQLSATGVISGYDITLEAAIAKMMFLFGAGLSAEEVGRQFVKPIVGEMTISVD